MSNAKKNNQSIDQPLKKKRASWKRGHHPITSTPPKKTESSETGPLNTLEYFVIFAIINYAMSKGLGYSHEQIFQLYNEIVELITEHESLMLLPISLHSQRELENIIRRVKKIYQRNN